MCSQKEMEGFSVTAFSWLPLHHAACWFGPFLGSVPHECNLDECSSLAFGLINNNINSNYCDRLINSFKNVAQCKRHEQILSGDNNFDRIIVDIISNFMFQNTTEIIKNFFFLSYFIPFYYSDCSCSSFLFPLSQLSVSYPSLILSLSAGLINVILPSGDILLFLGHFDALL